MKRPTRGREQQEGRRRFVPKKESSPLPMIAGIGGGVFVLIIIIAVAFSGDGPPPPPPPPPAAAPAPNVGGRTVSDTGSILFICANSPDHEDKEVVIKQCACGTRSKFYVDEASNRFYCFTCKNAFPSEQLKCDSCGKPPSRGSRIKR